ncbi:MAG: adenosine deaminase family protein [Acidobacteriota bacterium]
MKPLPRAALARLPKADLHLHLEGAVLPSDLARLYPPARRPPIPRRLWPRLYRFDDLQGFLGSFGALCRLLETADDFGHVAERLAGRLIRQGVRRAEIFVSLPVHLRRGLSGEAILESILARRETLRGAGLDLRLILDGVRQWGADSLAPCLALARRYRGDGVVGIGLGGDEAARDPLEFQSLFQAAREAGLHTVLHSGELGGPRAIERDLRVLEPERVGHALRAAEDPALLDFLAQRRLPVEVAITSNWKTGLLRRRADHPLPRFLRHRMRVVLAADDPAFFGTTLLREYAQVQRLFGLRAAQVRELAAESLRASFADAAS